MADQGRHSGRRRADHAIAAHLASGTSVVATAKLVGVAPRTVHRRLKDPAFLKMVDAAQVDMIKRTTGRLVHYSLMTANRLARLTKSKDEKVAVSAARSLMLLVLAYRGDVEVENKIRELEDKLDGSKEPTTASTDW